MRHEPDNLTLPLKEGLRDLRSTIRLEAGSGRLASHFFGHAEPARSLARIADGVLGQAERVAGRVLRRPTDDLDASLDRLGEAIEIGNRKPNRADDLYRVCSALLAEIGSPGDVVSELRLAAADFADDDAPAPSDRTAAAARMARRLARMECVRPCFSAAVAAAPSRHPRGDVNKRLALACWLAVLVRAESRADAESSLESARWAVEAEGAAWADHLENGREAELADAWRQTVPYLP